MIGVDLNDAGNAGSFPRFLATMALSGDSQRQATAMRLHVVARDLVERRVFGAAGVAPIGGPLVPPRAALSAGRGRPGGHDRQAEDRDPAFHKASPLLMGVMLASPRFGVGPFALGPVRRGRIARSLRRLG